MSNSNPNELDYYRRLRETAEATKLQGESDLEAAYGTKKTALERSRVQQRQEAAINNELLMKYLPQLNKANGLAGLGVSETANIDALSRYQTNLGDIEATHRQGMSDLDAWRSGKESEILSAYRSDLAKIDAAERGEIKEDEQRRYDEAAKKYDEAALYLQSAGITDQDTLDKYLTSMGYEKGSDEYNTLSVYASPYLKKAGEREEGFNDTVAEDGTEIVATYGGGYSSNPFGGDAPTNLGTAGTAIKVNAGDTTLILESQGLADKSIADAARGVIKNGEVFTYNDGIYLKDGNNVYVISGSNGEYGGTSYNALLQYLNGGHMPGIEFKSDDLKRDHYGIVKERNGNTITYYDENGNEQSAYLEFLTKNSASTLGEGEIIKRGNELQIRIGDNHYRIVSTPPQE